jgi:hypothetical protein
LQFRSRPLAFSRVKITVVNDPAKALALDQELSALLAKGAIEPVDTLLHPRGFYSRYFLVKRKDGRFRPILDPRGLLKVVPSDYLQESLKVLPFPMLTVSDTLRVVTRGEWFTTVDLKDAYFHVSIAPHHQHFLRSEGPAVFGRLADLCPVPVSGGPGHGSATFIRDPAGPDG